MVVLPYKDRLLLLSRYLQQLVMESLGKERDRQGRIVNQGIAVYGNKGSTDQHAYVQQLREGRNDFFAVFVQTLRDRSGPSIEVEQGATSGDYLLGFLEGTRRALYENDRQSVTLTVPALDARALGGLIALFERAVGLYASLIDVNAYHQPGVEAGKKAAGKVLALQAKVLAALRARAGTPLTADEVAEAAGVADEIEIVWKLLEHAAANAAHGVVREAGAIPFDARYRA
jgi:glucose-6-phosphate isomerase